MTQARKQITHIDGKEIISREAAMVPHPHPSHEGKLVPTSGVEHVLLEDGSETNICVECGYANDNARAVVAHMSGKHSETRSPTFYDEKTLIILIREVKRAKAQGRRDFATAAAERLNELGLKTYYGDPWTNTNVSSVFNQHAARYPEVGTRVKAERIVIKGTPPMTEAAAAVRARVDDVPSEPPASLAQVLVDGGDVDAFMANEDQPLHSNPRIAKTMRTARITKIHRMLNDLARELTFLDNEWSRLTEKAKAYDKLKETLATLGLARLNDE